MATYGIEKYQNISKHVIHINDLHCFCCCSFLSLLSCCSWLDPSCCYCCCLLWSSFKIVETQSRRSFFYANLVPGTSLFAAAHWLRKLESICVFNWISLDDWHVWKIHSNYFKLMLWLDVLRFLVWTGKHGLQTIVMNWHDMSSHPCHWNTTWKLWALWGGPKDNT